MTPSNNLSFLFLLLLVTLAGKVQSQDASFAINGFTPLTYERDAYVPPDKSFVRLVPSEQGGTNQSVRSVGRVLYSTPVSLWQQNQQASFETTFTFQVTPSPTNNTAYGLTFFVIPVNSTTPNGGEQDHLGIYGSALVPGSPMLVVEFDFVRAFVYDPPYAHLGININSIQSQNHTRLPYVIREPITGHITYDAPTRMITAVATFGSTTATTSFVFNLKTILPQQVQIGLSASTGSQWPITLYDAYTWHFKSTVVPDLNAVIDSEQTLLTTSI